MSLKDRIKELIESINSSKKEQVHEEPVLVTRFGRQFEQSFFGYTLPDDANLFFSRDEYSSFSECLNEVKKTQPEGYDSSRPTEGCNERFFNAVKSFLGSRCSDELQLFISIGTKLDFWHGVDGVFCFRDVYVTIDLTVDLEKEYKADFLIFPKDVESGEVYTSIARNIALLLLQKYLAKFGFKGSFDIFNNVAG